MQAVIITLRTVRYRWYIYSHNFGHDLFTLLGKRREYVEIEMERMIKEALQQDERILDVTDFAFEPLPGSKLGYKASFMVSSKYGSFSTQAVI